MEIFGNIVKLRAMELEDIELSRRMINDPEIEHMIYGVSMPLSKYENAKWYEQHHSDNNTLRLIIEVDSNAIGIITLQAIDWKNRRAGVGIKIADEANRNNGYGTDALLALMKYAFDELGMIRLDSSHQDVNMRMKRVQEKTGWSQEGVRRKYLFKNGEWHDLYIMGILADDYYKR